MMQIPVDYEHFSFDHHRSSSDELLKEWQLVNKSEDSLSDDDSIEIIQRETEPPSIPTTSDSEFDESENDEHFEDLGNDVGENARIRTVMPLNQCHSCLVLKKRNGEVDEKNGITSKVLYSFLCGVLASLILHYYKNCISEKFFNLSFGSEFSSVETYSMSFPFAHLNPFAEELSSSEASSNEDELMRLRRFIKQQRVIVDKIFTKQLDWLEHIRQVENETYVFNITALSENEPSMKAEDFINQFQTNKPIKACEYNLTKEQLPLVCEDNHVFLVFVEEGHVVSLFDAIRRFFGTIENKANTLRENLLNSLTKSNYFEDEVKNFGTDCDHFSKHCKAEPYCETSHSFKENDKLNGRNDLKSCSKAKSNKEVDVNEEMMNLKGVGRQLSQGVEDVTESAPYVDEANSEDSESDKFDADQATEAGKGREEKSISGEWLFNLHKARAKMRAYFDNVVEGDWILKLGKAREWLRRTQSREDKENIDKDEYDNEKKSYHHWCKKTSEKLKRKVKPYITKWKYQFKVMTDKVTVKFKDLKSKWKKKFHALGLNI